MAVTLNKELTKLLLVSLTDKKLHLVGFNQTRHGYYYDHVTKERYYHDDGFNSVNTITAGYQLVTVTYGDITITHNNAITPAGTYDWQAGTVPRDIGNPNDNTTERTFPIGNGIYVPNTVSSATILAWYQEVTRNPQVLYNSSKYPFNKGYPTPYRKMQTRYQYLNDLMQHREPFGPRSRQK